MARSSASSAALPSRRDTRLCPWLARISLEGVTVGEHLVVEMEGATAVFTTRRGGVSDGPYESLNLGKMTGDDEARVEANRERLGRSVGIGWDRFRWARQVHGTTIARGDEPEADGQV